MNVFNFFSQRWWFFDYIDVKISKNYERVLKVYFVLGTREWNTMTCYFCCYYLSDDFFLYFIVNVTFCKENLWNFMINFSFRCRMHMVEVSTLKSDIKTERFINSIYFEWTQIEKFISPYFEQAHFVHKGVS